MSNEVADQTVSTVLTALAKREFRWRTVAGVAKETGLAQELVIRALSAAADRIIKSSVPSVDGEDLYTTREHFRESASPGEKLRGAIKNRAL
jgi:hypothetical protein